MAPTLISSLAIFASLGRGCFTSEKWHVIHPKPNFPELDSGKVLRRGGISDANDNVLYHSPLGLASRNSRNFPGPDYPP